MCTWFSIILVVGFSFFRNVLDLLVFGRGRSRSLYAAEGEVDLALLGLGHESDGSWAGELLAAWDSS